MLEGEESHQRDCAHQRLPERSDLTTKIKIIIKSEGGQSRRALDTFLVKYVFFFGKVCLLLRFGKEKLALEFMVGKWPRTLSITR